MERARAAPEQPSRTELVDFILSLAHASDGVGQYVHAFALAGEPETAADLARSELLYLQSGERDYDQRHRQGSSFVDRADRFFGYGGAICVAGRPRGGASAVAGVY